MDINERIKTCPFCGNEPTIRIFRGKNGWRDRYAVICRYDEGGCGAESGLYHSEAEAVEAWNKRSGEQERKKGEWIPCSEKLPVDDDEMEDDEVVLVSDGIDYAVAFWRSDAEAWDDPLHGWLDSFEFDVKAWMPLPEPYKEEGEKHEGSD